MGVLEQGRLRANPAYELVLLDRLEPPERALAGEIGGEDAYGVLRPRPGSGLEPRLASTDTALLFLTLVEPQPLPGYVRARLAGDLGDAIGGLLLDGVLELEHEGGFVSGAAAAPLLAAPAAGGRGRIGELSTAALRYGQRLGTLEEPLLAMRLYLYGRIPLSAALRARLPDEDAVADLLGIGRGGALPLPFGGAWVAAPEDGGADAHWRSWRPRQSGDASRSRTGTGHKLYVSPAIDALPRALAAVAAELRGMPGLSAFKVGRDPVGVCRPDKLVVYFDRLDDLQRAGEVMRESLAGCPAHGVPFTAPLTADGLLSWGADPPAGGSWRLWIAERLAEYLTQGQREGGAVREPWRFALDRLRLAGVDTDTWAPKSGIWQAAGAG